MTENSFALLMNIGSVTVIIFCVHLLLLRSLGRPAYIPLALFLISLGVLVCRPALVTFSIDVQVFFLVLSLPALLLLSPSLWLYVQAITQDSKWQLSELRKRHFIPFSLGLIIAIITLLLPHPLRLALLVDGDDSVLNSQPLALSYIIYALLILTFALIMGWVIQSGFYLVKIFKRLHHYRLRLKDIFASTEKRELQWLTWLLVAIGGIWLLAIINLVVDNLFFSTSVNAEARAMLVLVLVWSICVWGLRQKPGFEELYELQKTESGSSLLPESTDKYQRSGLDKQRVEQIAHKLKQAMQEDKIYLDSSLSLPKLSQHIHTPANYISQTLSECIGLNFFDYVNRQRIEAAKLQLVESNDTVLDIAMAVGFNAKSSFYTAFKKETGQTPTQFREVNGA